jgi:hypothetical protein
MTPITFRRLVLALTLLCALVAGVIVQAQRATTTMLSAANAFLASLTPEQKKQATFAYDADERMHWNFIPDEAFPRNGLPIKDMTEPQRKLAMALLQSGLSARGYQTYTSIMALENILRAIEGGQRFKRDPEAHRFSIFGTPDAKGTWGWRVEGHHISLNLTIAAGKAIAATPAFFGSNPGEVKNGPRKGVRVLGNDEEMGRAIVKSMTDDQKAVTIWTKDAPKEMILVPKEKIRPLTPAGIAWDKLNPKQQEALWVLIEEYANRLRGELAGQDLEKAEKAGKDKISFAWAGGLERGEPHYYRVQGPTFVIEYDNVQNGANHVHSVWHDPASNFGEDILRLHHQAEHNK